MSCFLGGGIEKPQRLSHAEVARRAGFSSRSYPRDIVQGKKKPSVKAIEGLAKAYRLNKIWKDFFFTLAAIDLPNVANFLGIDNRAAKKKIAKLRKTTSVRSSEGSSPAVKISDFLLIYSALGKVGIGHSLKKIKSMTSLPIERLKRSLKMMEEQNLVQFHSKTGCYSPLEMNLFEEGLGGEKQFRDLIADTARQIAKKVGHARTINNSDCYYVGCVSVKRSNLNKLKQEFQEMLSNHMLNIEDESGDTSLKIFATQFRVVDR